MQTDSTELIEDIETKTSAWQAYLNENLPKAVNFCIMLVIAILVLLIGSRIIKAITKAVKKSLEKSRIDAGVASFLCSMLKWILYFVLILIILGQFGVTTGSVVAVLGSAGLTMGLALQGSLSNFAGGVLILLLKPFVVGDYILEKSTGLEGKVTAITIFYTHLTTMDNKEISIPNGNLSNTGIINYSKNDKRRVDIQVGVAYDTDLKLAKKVLLDLGRRYEKTLAEEEVVAFVSELGDSAITMELRVWTKTEDYWQTKWDLTEEVKETLDANEISIPFPQLDVAIKK